MATLAPTQLDYAWPAEPSPAIGEIDVAYVLADMAAKAVSSTPISETATWCEGELSKVVKSQDVKIPGSDLPSSPSGMAAALGGVQPSGCAALIPPGPSSLHSRQAFCIRALWGRQRLNLGMWKGAVWAWQAPEES